MNASIRVMRLYNRRSLQYPWIDGPLHCSSEQELVVAVLHATTVLSADQNGMLLLRCLGTKADYVGC